MWAKGHWRISMIIIGPRCTDARCLSMMLYQSSEMLCRAGGNTSRFSSNRTQAGPVSQGSAHMTMIGGGGFSEIRYHEGVRTPPLFLKMVRGGFFRVFLDASTPFVRIFYGVLLLGCISTHLSLSPMQPLLILFPCLGTPENAAPPLRRASRRAQPVQGSGPRRVHRSVPWPTCPCRACSSALPQTCPRSASHKATCQRRCPPPPLDRPSD